MAAYQLIRRTRYSGWNTSTSRQYGVSGMVGSPVGAKHLAVPPVSFYRCCKHSVAAARSLVAPVNSICSYRGKRGLHITSTRQELSQFVSTIAAYPTIRKVVAKGKSFAQSIADIGRIVPLLPPEPPHSLQSRTREVQKLQDMFNDLQSESKAKAAVTVYITGRPGFGKSQLAGEFGREFFSQHKRFPLKKVFVGTIDATNKDTLVYSCCKLAKELGCTREEITAAKFETLKLLSLDIRQKLRQTTWLLIVDNLGAVNNWEGRGAVNADWNTLWPQPGEEEWGKGCVLVTTQDRTLVKRTNPSAGERYLSEMMSVKDAADMLEAVSGVKDDDASKVASSLNRTPLSIARYMHYPQIFPHEGVINILKSASTCGHGHLHAHTYTLISSLVLKFLSWIKVVLGVQWNPS